MQILQLAHPIIRREIVRCNMKEKNVLRGLIFAEKMYVVL